ncbi:MAG: AsmA-like C-terminal region-containing protein [Verrucomicrobiota bacterium]
MPSPPGFWRKCRTGLRWFRITVVFAALALVCALVWFNRIGLPDFLKRRLVQTLQTRGIELEFTRMRLHFVRGLVIENVHIGHAKAPDDPVLSLAEIQLQLNYRALLRRQWQVDGLILRHGNLIWPLTPTNGLTLGNIQAELRFQTNSTWSLDHFQAEFAGANLSLSGDIIHAPEIRNWDIFRGTKPAGRAVWQTRLRKLSDTLDRIQLAGTPQLSLVVDGDARDIHSFAIRLNLNAASVQTPWGGARDLRLAGNLTAPAGTPTSFIPSWAWWTNAQPYRLTWTAKFRELKSEKLNADFVECNGFWRAPELAVTKLSAGLGGGQLEATARLNLATRELTFTNSSCFNVHAIAALLTEKTRERLADFTWTQPPSLQAGGSLILPAWTPLMRDPPDWRNEVQPTIQLNGELAITNGVYRGVAIDLARTHFSYSNLQWQLPDLALVKSKSRLKLSGGEDDATKDYHWHIHGVLDPEAARPFLTTSNAVRGFEIIKFTEPPAMDADVAGRLYDYDSIAASGRVALTNFAVRGQRFDDAASALNYTNRVLEFVNPLMHTGAQMMTADKVTLDFNTRLICFTNGFSTADPEPVARAIGPKTGRVVEPYHFLQPPTVRVNGQVPLHDMNGGRDMADADLRFDIIQGAPFEWLKFRTTNIVGTIHWQNQSLILTNVAAAFYNGTGNGFANFDFRAPHEGADYQFVVNVTNVNLHSLASDLSSPTNHLEGILAGSLVVTDADSRDWQTWDGFGHADLHDGLLWDIPIFGILSPVLNAFMPGLGNSRATDGSTIFSITNGVIYTDSLEIRSAMMRLDYTGTVDLKQNVHARVNAQLLRNTWVVGPLVSTMLWPVSKLFEYKITGTLKNPKSDPVYVLPRLLLMPLHPIRTLEEMFPGGAAGTNAPPGN